MSQIIKEILAIHEAEDTDTVKGNYIQFEISEKPSKDILGWLVDQYKMN